MNLSYQEKMVAQPVFHDGQRQAIYSVGSLGLCSPTALRETVKEALEFERLPWQDAKVRKEAAGKSCMQAG